MPEVYLAICLSQFEHVNAIVLCNVFLWMFKSYYLVVVNVQIWQPNNFLLSVCSCSSLSIGIRLSTILSLVTKLVLHLLSTVLLSIVMFLAPTVSMRETTLLSVTFINLSSITSLKLWNWQLYFHHRFLYRSSDKVDCSKLLFVH